MKLEGTVRDISTGQLLTGTAPKRIDDVMHSAREKAEWSAAVFFITYRYVGRYVVIIISKDLQRSRARNDATALKMSK